MAAVLTLGVMTADAQIVVDDFAASRNEYGDVVLTWSPPSHGVPVSHYVIWRKQASDPGWTRLAELNSSIARQFTDPYSGLTPNATYTYALDVFDISDDMGSSLVTVKVTPPPDALSFTSTPPTTASIGTEYFYSPSIASVADQRDIEYSFVTYPTGLELNYVGNGFARITWTPKASQVGYHSVTLLAQHKKTGARGVQEFAIRVSATPGTVLGYVFANVDGLPPVKNARVRIHQVQNALMYEALTDANGYFVLPEVQTGTIYAYCETESNTLAPQWYPFGKTLVDVVPRDLKANDTLGYAFYLMPTNPVMTRVAGTVRNALGFPVQGAQVSFAPKSSYFHIGDTTLISNPGFYSAFRYDTTLLTDASGFYEAWLPSHAVYYPIVRHADYAASFANDQTSAAWTNALESRAFEVDDAGRTDLNFTLAPVAGNVENRIAGLVTNIESGVNKQAIIVLIDAELKRGGGGGHTYRRYVSTVTDIDGRYEFENLNISKAYSLLAIPLEPGLSPQYFSANGGTTNYFTSDDITANGTVQNIDFKLQPTRTHGVGTIYGRVMVRQDGDMLPGAGTLVYAFTSMNQVYGYAVADSNGWYSIPGLPSGPYTIHADHTRYGSAPGVFEQLPTLNGRFNVFDATRRVDLTINSIATSLPTLPTDNGFALAQNYPNPFNPETVISLSIPRSSDVTVRVTDAMGREVRLLHEGRLEAGRHNLTFDGRELPSGTYFYQLISGTTVLTRSMLLIK